MENPTSVHCLLVDIGATNSRFNLYKINWNDLPQQIRIKYFSNISCKSKNIPLSDESPFYNSCYADSSWGFNTSKLDLVKSSFYSSQIFVSFKESFNNYLATLKDLKLEPKDIFVGISVCGPVNNQTVSSMSNLFWKDVNVNSIKVLGFKNVYLSNDFESFGYGIARSVKKSDFIPVLMPWDLLDKEGNLLAEAKELGAVERQKVSENDNRWQEFSLKEQKKVLCVGIGSGVGTVMINYHKVLGKQTENLEIMPSEASHSFFGCKNERDIKLMRFLAKGKNINLSEQYVAFESFISAHSILLIHKFLYPNTQKIYFTAKDFLEELELTNHEELIETLKYYLELLGQYIHQVSVAFLPDMTILRGNLINKLNEILKKNKKLKMHFWSSLLAKSHMAPTFQRMKVFTIKEDINWSMIGSLMHWAEELKN